MKFEVGTKDGRTFIIRADCFNSDRAPNGRAVWDFRNGDDHFFFNFDDVAYVGQIAPFDFYET